MPMRSSPTVRATPAAPTSPTKSSAAGTLASMDHCVTGHVLRDQFFHEVIEIINEARVRHLLRDHEHLE